MTRRAMRLLRLLTGTRNLDGARAGGGGMLLVMMALAGFIAAKPQKDDSHDHRSMKR